MITKTSAVVNPANRKAPLPGDDDPALEKPPVAEVVGEAVEAPIRVVILGEGKLLQGDRFHPQGF